MALRPRLAAGLPLSRMSVFIHTLSMQLRMLYDTGYGFRFCKLLQERDYLLHTQHLEYGGLWGPFPYATRLLLLRLAATFRRSGDRYVGKSPKWCQLRERRSHLMGPGASPLAEPVLPLGDAGRETPERKRPCVR